MTEFLPIIIVLIVAIVFLANGIKIAGEDERFAVFMLGRFSGFRGPGLIVVAPFVQIAHRLTVGDIGTLKSAEFAEFSGVGIPIPKVSDLRNGQKVRIDRFNDAGPGLAVESGDPVSKCPKCGHRY